MSNPVCAIVGAGEGLGRALAAKFASHGFDIALVSRSEKHRTVAAEAAANTNANVRVQFWRPMVHDRQPSRRLLPL